MVEPNETHVGIAVSVKRESQVASPQAHRTYEQGCLGNDDCTLWSLFRGLSRGFFTAAENIKLSLVVLCVTRLMCRTSLITDCIINQA